MTFSVEQLQAFVAAAEQGSFSAAARHLGKAQSVVSVAVSHLEIDCGVELFDRSGRTPVLTGEGRALLRDARAILQRCDEMRASAAALGRGVETRLTLAVDAAIAMETLVPHLAAFDGAFPHLEFELLNPTSQDVAELVSSGRADLGVMFEQEFYPRGFNFTGIDHVEVIAVAGPGHPLAALPEVRLPDLEQHRQLMPTTRTAGVRGAFELQGGRCWRLESQYGILALVRADFGWAYLPKPFVREDLERGRVVPLRLAFQQVDIQAGIDLIWRRDRAAGPAARWLIERLSGGSAPGCGAE
ncbi:LysR family transcriptional regulator [Marinobacterium nitratireducens]|uniref:LysR family transcriptional regulator n=1 Tax=Marinobacterium nitratireducens TaxID=518897 RepID=A0A917ZK26_9GAMM|nr:LysR family transcriptional regulator [Marinobacterium nitratireducens]GGO83554.1 LysR family transcriptional regulator [Marinobacterium nitratireducens]